MKRTRKEHKCPYCGKWVKDGIWHTLNHDSFCEGIPAVSYPPTDEELKLIWKEAWENNLKENTIEAYIERMKQNMSPKTLETFLKALENYVNRE